MLGFVTLAAVPPFARHGDAIEYIVTAEAWFHHASPEIRNGDVQSLRRLPAAEMDGPMTVVEAPNGARYAAHFWLYSLLCIPAKALLHLLRANELKAFALTNALGFALAAYAAWSWGARTTWRRRAFAALAVAGPAFWYIRWSSPETLSWACVVGSLVALDRKRYPLSAALAGLGALQNPPIAMLAGAVVALSLSTRRIATIAQTVLGAATSLLATSFYLVKLGVANPIVKVSTDVALVSLSRTSSLLLDADQGLLPYAPLLVLGLPFAVVQGLRRRHGATLLVAAALAVMVASVQVQKNWNGGCAGIIRYGVWMLPLMAWLLVRELPARRAVYAAVGVGLAYQLATVARWRGAQEDYLEHHALGRALLNHAPSLYNPDPEIFAERTLHKEFQAYELPGLLPVAYERPDGEITKLLVSPESLSMLRREFQLSPGYVPILAARAGDGPLAVYHYVDPPKGAVRRSFPPMRLLYGGCDRVAPEHDGRWCMADSQLAIENLGDGPGHVRLEVTFERTATPCQIDVEVQGRHERVQVAPGRAGVRFSSALVVPGKQQTWFHFVSADPGEPNGAHHLERDAVVVRADDLP